MRVSYAAVLWLLLAVQVHAQEEESLPDEAFLEFLGQFDPDEDALLDIAFDVSEEDETKNGPGHPAKEEENETSN